VLLLEKISMSEHIVICERDNSFNVLFFHNPQPMWIVDVNTLKFMAVNEAAIKHYGYTRDEFRSIDLMTIRPLHEHEQAKELIKNIKNKETISKELTHIKKDGHTIFVHITSYTVNYRNCLCRMVIINDVTPQKIKDVKLKNAWDKVRMILESITDGFITLNNSLKITYWNKEAERIFNIERNKALNRPILQVLPQIEGTMFYQRLIDASGQNKPERFEQFLPLLNKWICPTIYLENGTTTIYLTDISNERYIQTVVDRKNKNLEEIAYLNSHIIRKEVANISGMVSLINDDLADPEALKATIAWLKLSIDKLDYNIKNINSKVEN
jgi:PAS domain S-box-containing protein